MSTSSRTLRPFHLSLRRELAAQFRVDPDHPGIERILEETEAHLEDTIAELVEGGATEEAAATTALSPFGTASRVARAYGALGVPSFIDPRAPHVDVPRWRRLLTRGRKMSALSQWFSDVRIAVRGLSRSPAYLLAFVLTLGLGIGANTAIFSVIHGIWLRALADHYFPDRDAVGQRIGWRSEMAQYISWDYRTIVGVVSDAKDYGVAQDVPHVIYNPFSQSAFVSSLFVRTPQPETVVRPIVDQIHELNPEQPIEDIATLAQIRSESISSQRVNAALVGAFTFLALTVAAVGVSHAHPRGASRIRGSRLARIGDRSPASS